MLWRFLGVVFSDDTAYRGEDFLHRWFLRFGRLRHAAPRLTHLGRAAREPVAALFRITPPGTLQRCRQCGLCASRGRDRHSIRKTAEARSVGLPAVRGPNADPSVPNLLIVHLRIIDHD